MGRGGVEGAAPPGRRGAALPRRAADAPARALRRPAGPQAPLADRRRRRGAASCDLVERRFVADRPNELWVCDLTYLKTREGFVYLAFVLDVCSRMIVGWQTATQLKTELVLDALEMAVHLRRPAAGELVAHTDRGGQDTSFRYTQRLADLGIAASVGSVADAYDNART